jgi:hypothetical protein
MDWNSAKTACDDLIINGYSDWRLPDINELNSLYANFRHLNVGGYSISNYWSSTEFNYYAYTKSFNNGKQQSYNKIHKKNVRAVRPF